MIEINQVSFSYDQRAVLSDISFTVEEGEKVAIIGPNGAGKSTLLKLISGLLKPGAGYIHIISGDYMYQPHKFNRRLAARLVAVVPQRAPQNADFTVEELILSGRYSRSGLLGYSTRDQKVVQSTIERCGLSGFQSRRLDELSGGELKRAMIARALVQEAPIVLLDEPTTDLDLRYQEEILQLVKGETGEKHLLVAVLHDLVLASRHFPRTIILSDGQLQADGKTPEVLSSQNITRAFNTDVDVEWWHGQLVLIPK
jgi:iron complex transport system ATP-binding protein